ncbi:DUF4233 domain-containing protein [Cumulibacter soli]|uniref:DUF4233 domain-containing protein n=1 Tax=Cumulibacter soli TaxID=2546344 RepID=UPI0010679DD8|nr:DUF4233 domain-containing protein [Cumulibacter soli]
MAEVNKRFGLTGPSGAPTPEPSDEERQGLPPVDKVKLERSMRGIYSALLIFEALIVLMVPATIRQFDVGLTGFRLTTILVIVAALIALCAFIKKPWANAAGWVLQVCVVAMGFWVWAMWVLGGFFVVLWWYAGHLHRQLRARPDLDPDA